MNTQLIANLPTIQPQGRLDSQQGLTLQNEIASVLSTSPERCIIDMQHVDTIDNTGLKILGSALSVSSRQECRLALCNLHPQTRMVLEISQFDQAFDIF